MNNQSLQSNHLLHRFHQWPLAMLSFILGAVIAVGISLLLPNHYRAEARLNVSYNADAIFRNPDDFKNWEMEQLDLIAFSAPVMEKTVSKLQQIDPSWQQVASDDLLASLRLYWRNVGAWRLVARASTPQRAVQLVEAWNASLTEVVDQALSAAQEMNILNLQQKSASDQLAQAIFDINELPRIKTQLYTWQETTPPSQLVDPMTRWQLFALAARIAPLDAAGNTLLESLPPADTPAQDYTAWLAQAGILIDQQVLSLNDHIARLSLQIDELNQQRDEAYQRSLGLSSYLMVKAVPGSTLPTKPERSHAIAALVGGVLGLIAYLLVWLAKPFLYLVK